MYDNQEGVVGSGRIVDGYGNDSLIDRLQGWDIDSQTYTRKEVDDEFVNDV